MVSIVNRKSLVADRYVSVPMILSDQWRGNYIYIGEQEQTKTDNVD